MWNAPIIEEVRAIRGSHAKKFNYDLKSIAADLRKQQKKSKHKVVSFSPKKPIVLPKTKVEKGS